MKKNHLLLLSSNKSETNLNQLTQIPLRNGNLSKDVAYTILVYRILFHPVTRHIVKAHFYNKQVSLHMIQISHFPEIIQIY